MNTSIKDFVEQCVAREQASEQAEKDAAAQEQLNYTESVKAQWRIFMSDAPALVPDLLRPHIVGHNGDDSHLPYRPSLCIDLPNCAQLLAKFDLDHHSQWVLISYAVFTYELREPDDYYCTGCHDYEVKFDRLIEFKVDQLELAVACAFQAEQARIDLVLEADLKNKERAAENAARAQQLEAESQRLAEKEEADAREYAERKFRDQQERDVALDFINNDRVALALAMAFRAVDAERRDWLERLDSAQDGAETSVEFYERKLSEARRQTESYRREVEEARSRAVDLEDAVAALKKQAKKRT